MARRPMDDPENDDPAEESDREEDRIVEGDREKEWVRGGVDRADDDADRSLPARNARPAKPDAERGPLDPPEWLGPPKCRDPPEWLALPAWLAPPERGPAPCDADLPCDA